MIRKLVVHALRFLKPAIKWWGGLHLPFTHRKITGLDYYKIRSRLLPGDVFLTSIRGEPSNLLNPCKIKHGAVYLGEDMEGIRWVQESVGGGVRKTDLVSFLTTKDVLIVARPRFLTGPPAMFALKVEGLLGLDYDYAFDLKNTAYYCFEAVVAAFNLVQPSVEFRKYEIVEDLWIYDHRTFLEDEGQFELIYSKGMT